MVAAKLRTKHEKDKEKSRSGLIGRRFLQHSEGNHQSGAGGLAQQPSQKEKKEI